jgi:UPF0755 protein
MSDELRAKIAKMTPEQRAVLASRIREKREKLAEVQENSRKIVKPNEKIISEISPVGRQPKKINAGSTKKADIKPRFERRPSMEIAKSFVELNVKAVIDAENEAKMSSEEKVKIEKAEKKRARREKRRKHRVRNIALGLIVVLAFAAASVGMWWNTSSGAVNPADKNEYQFTVASGATVDNIADALAKAGFIKNALAFRIYARLNGVTVRAGTFNLSPSDDMSSVAKKLSSNATAEITVMIPPGMNLKQLRDTFKKAGFGDTDIDTALNATYTNSILADRPKSATLEGYVFPDTYTIGVNDDLKTLINKALDELATVAKKDDLKNKFAKQGLSFYEGLTLSSVITKEVPTADEQKTVAGVFFNRLNQSMPLQSDPTFKFAYAMGLCANNVNDPTCDSAYNTYTNAGLPPGPIANPSESALEAVASPTASDYLYFLADNNGVTHFAKTLDEQTANINKYYNN